MEKVEFKIKKDNKEIEKLINQEATNDLLFKIGLPNTDYLDFTFDNEIKIISKYIIIGKYFKYDIAIDMDNNKSVFIYNGKVKMLINSSLSQFAKFILLFVDFIDKKENNPAGRSMYLHEWGKEMIKIDKEAYEDSGYWWGSLFEQYEQGVLL